MSTWIHLDPKWFDGCELLPALRYTAVVRVGWCCGGQFEVAQADEPAVVLELMRGMLEQGRERQLQEQGEFDVEGWIFYTQHCLEGGAFLGGGDPCIQRLWHEVQCFSWVADDGFGALAGEGE